MEIWKPVVGYEGVYEVSNLGRVKRIGVAQGARVGLVQKPVTNRCGYSVVTLQRDAVRTGRTVHSLVAEAFIGPRPRGKQVNHKNGVKSDNFPLNLEYLTPKENVLYSMRVLGRTFERGENIGTHVLTEAKVSAIKAAIRKAKIPGRINRKRGSMKRLEEKYGISGVTLHRIATGKAWAHVK